MAGLSALGSRVGQVLERASADAAWQPTVDDDADLHEFALALSRFVDRNMAEDRRLAAERGVEPPTVRERVGAIAAVDLAGAMGGEPGAEGVAVLLAGTFEVLATLDVHEIAERVYEIEDSATGCGAMTSALKVHLARAVLVLKYAHERGVVEPLVQFPQLLDAWTLLVWALVERYRRLQSLSWQLAGDDGPTEEAEGEEPVAEREHGPPPPVALLTGSSVRRHAPPSRRCFSAAVGTCPTSHAEGHDEEALLTPAA